MTVVEATPPVERQVVSDMVRRSLPVLPVLVALAGLGWGTDGAASAAYAIGLVLVNFLFSAVLLETAARISLPLLMVAALGGFVVRLAMITAAVLVVKDQSWVALVPLSITLIVTHLGLLIWESRHISATLAYPALKPTGGRP
jgi:hypothetical protein